MWVLLRNQLHLNYRLQIIHVGKTELHFTFRRKRSKVVFESRKLTKQDRFVVSYCEIPLTEYFQSLQQLSFTITIQLGFT